MRLPAHLSVTLALATGCTPVAGPGTETASTRQTVRIATFNASLARSRAGELAEALATPDDPQARAIAAIVQRVRPDVLLINEFDYDAAGAAARGLLDNYLAVAQGDTEPIEYEYLFAAPSNTGVLSGVDLDRDGDADDANDALGFGAYPGQYGMLLLSRFPIDRTRVRTFREFRWCDMPGASWPDDPTTPVAQDWYRDEAKAVLRLSSKSHWDVPVRIGDETVHVLASHPTPPVFDGPEDRNGHRNHDEIRFWADYVDPSRSGYIYDDADVHGGLPAGAAFVIAGDLNADPNDGESVPGSIEQLLDHQRVHPGVIPASRGAVQQSREQGHANAFHRGEPAYDTADFNDDPTPGNLRVDYVLPSRNLHVVASGVFWPAHDEPGFELVGASDHRMVWVDVE